MKIVKRPACSRPRGPINRKQMLMKKAAIRLGVFVTLVFLVVSLVVALGRTAQAGILYGITDTNVVTIDPSNPANVAIVGPHGIAPGTQLFNLAYHPGTNKLYTLAGLNFNPSTSSKDQKLIEINLATGAGSVIADLGTFPALPVLEILEFVGSQANLVTSRDPNLGVTFTTELVALSLTGTQTLLSSNAPRDNDYGVWDSQRDLFYTTDPNDEGQLVLVHLSTGASLNLGAIPFSGESDFMADMAYSSDADAIFALNKGNANFYRVTTTSGLAPISVTLVGQTGGSELLRGLAFLPEPATFVLLLLGLPLCGLFRRRAKPLR